MSERPVGPLPVVADAGSRQEPLNNDAAFSSHTTVREVVDQKYIEQAMIKGENRVGHASVVTNIRSLCLPKGCISAIAPLRDLISSVRILSSIPSKHSIQGECFSQEAPAIFP
jgi:hypothetical protein